MFVVGSISWLMLCSIPPPAGTFMGCTTVPLMTGFFVFESTAAEATVRDLSAALWKQNQATSKEQRLVWLPGASAALMLH